MTVMHTDSNQSGRASWFQGGWVGFEKLARTGVFRRWGGWDVNIDFGLTDFAFEGFLS